MARKPNQELNVAPTRSITAPRLPYEPRLPRRYAPGIGLIGCGNISQSHLRAYAKRGVRIVALCDLDLSRARARQKEFFPDAVVYEDFRAMLKRDDIEVVDIATHPKERQALIAAALKSGRHVLSQKPFVVDLDVGERLADLADAKGVRLAVNQNGRWAPYFSYMRQAVAAGVIGDTYAVHLDCHWDHEVAISGGFNRLYHLVLYDFAIHWFDMVHCLMGTRKPTVAHATLSRSPGQKAWPPLLAEVLLGFEGGQASLVFDGCTRQRSVETATVIGTRGMLRSVGELCNATSVEVSTADGVGMAKLQGTWFPDGFAGTMGELLCAIDEKREPLNNARDNLASLALCYAAIASADSGEPKRVGAIRKLPLARCTPRPE
jgi:predicted dehydrogenase